MARYKVGRYCLFGGPAKELEELNPKLYRAELCLEIDTGLMKIGNGIDRYLDLPYANRGPEGPRGEVGQGLNIKASLATEDELPKEIVEGDAYIIKGDLYVAAGDAYINVGQIQGVPGDTPYIKDGYWWIGDKNLNVRASANDGLDGDTPEIGPNGNWWIGGYDTKKTARGPIGPKGDPGPPGPPGITVSVVNDLTTGGVDKALSAEQGKVLSLKIDQNEITEDKIVEIAGKVAHTEWIFTREKDIYKHLNSIFGLQLSPSIQNLEDLVNSEVAMNYLTNNPVFMNAIVNNVTFITAIVKSDTAMNALLNSEFLNILVNNEIHMAVVVNSSVAMQAVVNSSVAMQAVVNSSVAMQAVIDSSVAMQAVANSSVAMQAVVNSSVAMQAVIDSSVAMQAVANSSVAMEIVKLNRDSLLNLEGINKIVVTDEKPSKVKSLEKIDSNGIFIITKVRDISTVADSCILYSGDSRNVQESYTADNRETHHKDFVAVKSLWMETTSAYNEMAISYIKLS